MPNRLLFERWEVAPDSEEVALPAADPRAEHVRTVWKKPPGARFRAGIVDGPLAYGIVLQSDPQGGLVVRLFPVNSDVAAQAPSGLLALPAEPLKPPLITLLLAVPRAKRLRTLLPQVANFGVRAVYLVNAARTEKAYFDTRPANHPPTCRELFVQGLMQGAVDTRVPELCIERHLKPFVATTLNEVLGPPERSTRILLHPDDAAQPLAGLFAAPGGIDRTKPIIIALGPEGGWVDYEVAELFRPQSFVTATMGAHILRSDTAVISALAVIRGLWDSGAPTHPRPAPDGFPGDV
eukprot:EG_transcript_16454